MILIDALNSVLNKEENKLRKIKSIEKEKSKDIIEETKDPQSEGPIDDIFCFKSQKT